MYLDVLSSEKVSSLASGASLPKATYAECLESIVAMREAEFAADRELLSIEFRNYHLGLEAEDASFWSKVQTTVRKLMEILKAVASKITAYIQTVPGRIHNFVLGVSNWFAKIGLENKAKRLMERQNQKMINEVKAKDFMSTEFGPMNFDEILLNVNTAEEADAAVKAAQPGVGKKMIYVFTSFITSIGTNFLPKFKASYEAKLREAHEQARTAGADTTNQSGTATLEKANGIAGEKLVTLKGWAESDKTMKEAMELIEDAARAINAGHKYNAVPSPDTILGMVKTVTNGNIEKQANGIINAIDRLKRQLDVIGRSVTAAFNRAYAQKDSNMVSDIQSILSECRYQYTLYIKMIVRVDTAAQRCTSNVIKYAKMAIDCYQTNPETSNAPKVEEAKTSAENNNNNNNEGEDSSTWDSNSKVQDFSHIFEF